MELESFLPARLLNPKIQAPKRKPEKLTYNQRQEAAVQVRLFCCSKHAGHRFVGASLRFRCTPC